MTVSNSSSPNSPRKGNPPHGVNSMGLLDERANIRIYTLGKMSTRTTQSEIEAVLNVLSTDQSDAVRVAAIESLARAFENFEAEGLDDKCDASVGGIDDWHRRAFLGVMAALSDPSPRVRREATSALGKSGSPTAIDRLNQLLKDDKILVRLGAASALEDIGDPQSVDVLLREAKMSRNPWTRRFFRAMAKRIGSKSLGHGA